MSQPKYPRRCRKYGHNHLVVGFYEYDGENAKPRYCHVTQCINHGGIWPFRRRCEHTEEWTPDMKETPPLTIFRDIPPTSPIKQGQTVYITIPGTADRKPMRTTNVTKKGEADESELEKIV